MADAVPDLLRAHPRLAAALPRLPLVPAPTPVEPLALPELAGRAWVKRDEASCPLYGGNKPRKLEFLLGQALERGARRLVTTGGLGTHHGLATTILGGHAGLETSLVLVDQPFSAEVAESLRLFAAYGAEVVYGRSLAGAALRGARCLVRSRLKGERPYRVPTGGSGPVGNVGLVAAGFELAAQVRAGLLPEPRSCWVAVGTGGTQVGLTLGLRLAGLATRVVGVRVSDILPPSPARLAAAARRTWARLRRLDPSLPRLALGPEAFPLRHGSLGPGYGAPTEAGRRAQERAAAAGLVLETTYTAKCLAELLAAQASGQLEPGPLVFWNTFNGVDVKARAPRPLDGAGLPEALRRRLDSARIQG